MVKLSKLIHKSVLRLMSQFFLKKYSDSGLTYQSIKTLNECVINNSHLYTITVYFTENRSLKCTHILMKSLLYQTIKKTF